MDKTIHNKTAQKRKLELNSICQWVNEGESVLDLGCGRGLLLEELIRLKNVYAVGVDLNFDKVLKSVKRGINVYHGDVLECLSGFEDKSFNWIICSRTLPELDNVSEVVKESLRVGEKLAIGFINHSYWKNRLSILFKGDRIVNEVYPKAWSSSRPTNQISVNAFKDFCKNNDIEVLKEHYLKGDWCTELKFMPSLFCGYAIFVIRKSKS